MIQSNPSTPCFHQFGQDQACAGMPGKAAGPAPDSAVPEPEEDFHFLHYLARHARKRPHKTALRCANGTGGTDQFEEWTFAQLHARVLAWFAVMQERARPGERVLLLLPSGEEFITSFLACLHAGLIAVPAYPPRRNRNRERVLSIHDNAAPALILTTTSFAPQVREALPDSQAMVLSVDGALPPPGGQNQWILPRHNSGHIAFLQYTSGSTGAPKGTIITHANLLANLAALQGLFQHEPEHEIVTWLPPFHDAGLMNLLVPLFSGMTVTMLPPEEFLRSPIRWLQVISSRSAYVCAGAPNFAYQLLAERVTEDEIGLLDLSRWRVAFNGAEPVQSGTLKQFAQRFAVCGFRAGAWVPCYGLAENTLLAAGRRSSGILAGQCGSGILRASRTALETGIFEPAMDDDGNAPLLVSCGPPLLNTHITIHSPETGVLLTEDHIGEIQLHSPSVAAGYWRNKAATAAAFPIPGTLRTGDLGFLHKGEIYLTGRVKDLIIIRGRKLHPQDIETCLAA